MRSDRVIAVACAGLAGALVLGVSAGGVARPPIEPAWLPGAALGAALALGAVLAVTVRVWPGAVLNLVDRWRGRPAIQRPHLKLPPYPANDDAPERWRLHAPRPPAPEL